MGTGMESGDTIMLVSARAGLAICWFVCNDTLRSDGDGLYSHRIMQWILEAIHSSQSLSAIPTPFTWLQLLSLMHACLTERQLVRSDLLSQRHSRCYNIYTSCPPYTDVPTSLSPRPCGIRGH